MSSVLVTNKRTKPKKTLRNLFLRNKAKFDNYLFVVREKKKLNKAFTKPYHILFSKKEIWNDLINKSFKSSKVIPHFEDFSSADFIQYDLVVPLICEDVLTCINRNIELRNQVIPIPNLNSFDICNNKLKLIKTLQMNGLDNYIPKTGASAKLPYILKKETGEYGRTTFVIETQNDESIYSEMIQDKNHFKQELITGNEEFASHIVFKNGRIVAHLRICYLYDCETYVQGKMVYVSKKIVEPKFNSEFTEVLKAIGYEGLCCIDYKIKDGLPKIFEINPRFGGSLTDYFFSFLNHLEA